MGYEDVFPTEHNILFPSSAEQVRRYLLSGVTFERSNLNYSIFDLRMEIDSVFQNVVFCPKYQRINKVYKPNNAKLSF
jgi:hypothetical protein